MAGARSWQYDDWTSALCEHFFPFSMAGAPVIFLVDEEELAEGGAHRVRRVATVEHLGLHQPLCSALTKHEIAGMFTR